MIGSYCVSGSFSGSRAERGVALRHGQDRQQSGARDADPCNASKAGRRARRHCPASVATSFQFGIARADVAREGPDVGDVGHLVGVAVDHRAVLGARHRDQLRPEAHRDLRGLAALLGGDEVGAVDRDEAGLDRLAASARAP